MTAGRGTAPAIAARFDGGKFYIVPPAAPGGDYTVRTKDDDTIFAVIRREDGNPVPRRWKGRLTSAPESVPWTYGSSMMDVARLAHHTWRNS